MTQTRTISALLAAAAAVGMLAGTGCRTANILSRNEEIRLGREGAEEIESQYEVSTNPADISLIEGIGQKIVAANGLDVWPYSFKVLENRQVNAISLPGGPIYIFRGLLDLTEGDEDELACIIAHEMGHIERRHIAKMYTQGIFTDLILIFGTQGALQNAAQIVRIFLDMRFSRDDEYESDSIAIRFTYKAGYDPNGLIRFFRKLQRLEKQGKGDILTNNLRTHPLTTARIERAEKEIAEIVRELNEQAEREYREGK